MKVADAMKIAEEHPLTITGGVVMTTCEGISLAPARLFAELSTEELRAMAAKTCSRTGWSEWSREMLLAFHHNRFGRFVPARS